MDIADRIAKIKKYPNADTIIVTGIYTAARVNMSMQGAARDFKNCIGLYDLMSNGGGADKPSDQLKFLKRQFKREQFMTANAFLRKNGLPDPMKSSKRPMIIPQSAAIPRYSRE